jgi:DNA-binding beta-propeller fold protein YncE
MHSLRWLAGRTAVALVLILASDQLVDAERPEPELTFSKLWTYGPETSGQLSEIAAFDPRTNTIWVVGIVGVDVVDADTGTRVTHIDVTPHGAVNSVAIHNGLAALAIEAASQSGTCPNCDRRNPGKVLFYDTATRQPSGNPVSVGSLPDMLTFTHDGRKLLVANEATPNAAADTAYLAVDPAGSVSIIDMGTRTVTTALFQGVPTSGSNLRLPTATGMDYEPEYIAIDDEGARAFVTLQEANGIAVLDLISNEFTEIIGLGAKDFSQAGNEEAFRRGIYDDGRSRDKGVEPEGVALLKIGSRTYAFIGLERVTTSAVAVFDISDLNDVRFVDMIVTAGDLSPEGLAAYKYRGNYYLAIANEVVAPNQTTSNTTLYLIESEHSRR